jgi:SAM-dependent methyltransferase
MGRVDANSIELFHFVNREVHPDDEMFRTAKLSMPEPGKAFHYYFYSGGLLATRLRNLMFELGERPARMSILDFACGYGRVTRYLDLIFNEVACSDLAPAMLNFNRDQFGARGCLSAPNIAAAQFPERPFDVAFSFSLFTHLNPAIWQAWFERVSSLVRPGGYLIFSTRSPEFARSRGEVFDDAVGIAFDEKNETDGRLDKAIYGQTTVSRAFVDDAATRSGGLERVRFFPGGAFDLFHDMHAFRRG